MNDMPEIRQLDDGRYTFVIGAQKYTLSTPMAKETFFRIVHSVQSAEREIPEAVTSHSDRLLLAFMNYVSETSNITDKLFGIVADNRKEEE